MVLLSRLLLIKLSLYLYHTDLKINIKTIIFYIESKTVIRKHCGVFEFYKLTVAPVCSCAVKPWAFWFIKFLDTMIKIEHVITHYVIDMKSELILMYIKPHMVMCS